MHMYTQEYQNHAAPGLSSGMGGEELKSVKEKKTFQLLYAVSAPTHPLALISIALASFPGSLSPRGEPGNDASIFAHAH